MVARVLVHKARKQTGIFGGSEEIVSDVADKALLVVLLGFAGIIGLLQKLDGARHATISCIHSLTLHYIIICCLIQNE